MANSFNELHYTPSKGKSDERKRANLLATISNCSVVFIVNNVTNEQYNDDDNDK